MKYVAVAFFATVGGVLLYLAAGTLAVVGVFAMMWADNIARSKP